MNFIRSPHSDVYFNLALEEELLLNSEEEFVLIYLNDDAVVLGKHQNAFAECQILRCKEAGVKVARRLSGGGTVYHGPGNINFSFIRNLKEDEPMIDFKRNLKPVLAFLHSLGLPAVFSGRNDILLHSCKISGNAEHVYQRKRRLIHHGTLLFNADLKRLSFTTEEKASITFETHAVPSVRSVVANLSDYLSSTISEDTFVQQFSDFLIKWFEAKSATISDEMNRSTIERVTQKFKTWDWIYGYSPSFTLTDGSIRIAVKKGRIAEHSPLSINLVDERFHPEIIQHIVEFDAERLKKWF